MFFFLLKIAWFRPRAKQTDATQACHKGGIVTKYLVIGGGASSRWAIICVVLLQKIEKPERF